MAARNAPKCHYYRVYGAGVVIPVVAQPIQDMSALSVKNKTVGVCLPRVWCGAIGWRTKLSIKFPLAFSVKGRSIFIRPFYP
jgi:hypothetical protein